MACLGCSCGTTKPDSKASDEGTPKGCASGGCASGGCNKRNTYDWITAMGIADAVPFDMVEVSFKNGARKDFYKNPPWARVTTGIRAEQNNRFQLFPINFGQSFFQFT